MDNKENLEDLKSIVKKFCDDRDWEQFHSPKELAIGMSNEANELLSLFRFKNEEEMEKMFELSKKRENIEDETADVFFFLLRFVQMYNIDLSDALKRKIIKNEQKYSINKFKGSNKKYSEE